MRTYINICRTCEELTPEEELEDLGGRCLTCDSAFSKLETEIRAKRDTLAKKLKADSPRACPYCKGTGEKP